MARRTILDVGEYARTIGGTVTTFEALASCNARTAAYLGATFPAPDVDDFDGATVTTSTGLTIQYRRVGTQHGKTVKIVDSATTPGGANVTYALMLPDDMSVNQFISNLQAAAAAPATIIGVQSPGGRFYPLNSAAAADDDPTNA